MPLKHKFQNSTSQLSFFSNFEITTCNIISSFLWISLAFYIFTKPHSQYTTVITNKCDPCTSKPTSKIEPTLPKVEPIKYNDNFNYNDNDFEENNIDNKLFKSLISYNEKLINNKNNDLITMNSSKNVTMIFVGDHFIQYIFFFSFTQAYMYLLILF